MRTPVKVLFAAFAFGLLAMPAWAQDSAPTLDDAIAGYESATHQFYQGIPVDWSSRHVVFSRPIPGSDAEYKVQQDPRYWMQQIRRSPAGSDLSVAASEQADTKKKKNKKVKKGKFQRDWSVVLNSSSGTPVATVGLEMFPTKFPFNTGTAPSCPSDYVVYNTSQPGVSGTSSTAQPNIIAYNNLYTTTCTGAPTVYWAYFTGTGSSLTSPVVSLSGTRVAFIESSATNHAILRLLQFKSGDGSFSSSTHNWTTVTPTTQTTWSSCTAGSNCLISITLSGTTPQDTNSAPWYNYAGDTLYVGDSNGVLHKFINVFGVTGSTPSEVTTGGWPITVHSATVLSSPVFDSGTNNIFVGDASGQGSYVRDTGSTTGTCSSGSPPCLGGTTIALGHSITDAPIVDSVTSKVFWFGLNSITTITDQLEQTTTALGSAVTITVAGGGASTGNMHSGAFDNLYFTSVSTGHLYFCAPDPASTNHPSLYDVGFNASGVMSGTIANGPLDISAHSASPEECSPLTEFVNGATDRLFASVNDNGSFAPCSGAGSCIYSFTITSTFPTTSSAGLAVAGTGGTSGIVVDNIGAATGESQVYYSQVSSGTCATSGGTGGCAVQAAQSGL